MSEDEDHIAFNNDHVEHGMNDGLDENEKTEAESKGMENTSTETTPYVAVETAGETGDERCIVGGVTITHGAHIDMSEGKEDGEDGEEAGETTGAKETERTSKKRRGNPKTHRGEEKHTQRRETAPKRNEQMRKKRYQRQERMKRQQDIQRILEDFKGVRNIPGIQSAKKESTRHKGKERTRRNHHVS